MADAAIDIEGGLRLQAHYCRELGAPFTAELIEAVADDYKDGGVCADLLKDWKKPVLTSALPLRFAGAFQHLARSGADQPLAEVYRDAGKGWTREGLRPLLADAAKANMAVMRDYVASAVQTNEVRRTAALLGGFIEAATATGLPLDLYEIGASAGLLLNWDRYAYDFGDFRWGDGSLLVEAGWKGPKPAWPARVEVATRRGCDIAPIDYESDEAVARAASYIWAEQKARRERFLAAIKIARHLTPEVERADAGLWLAEKLKGRPEGRCAVVYQSVMGQYLSDETRKRVKHAIGNAAQIATKTRPLAWLRFEPDAEAADLLSFAVDLTIWPDGKTQRLARAHPHGEWVEWLAA